MVCSFAPVPEDEWLDSKSNHNMVLPVLLLLLWCEKILEAEAGPQPHDTSLPDFLPCTGGNVTSEMTTWTSFVPRSHVRRLLSTRQNQPKTLQKYFLESCMQCEWEHPWDTHSLSCHTCISTWCWYYCAEGRERVCWYHRVRFHLQVCVFCCQASSAVANTHLHWLPSLLPSPANTWAQINKPFHLHGAVLVPLLCCMLWAGQRSALAQHAKCCVARGDQLLALAVMWKVIQISKTTELKYKGPGHLGRGCIMSSPTVHHCYHR